MNQPRLNTFYRQTKQAGSIFEKKKTSPLKAEPIKVEKALQGDDIEEALRHWDADSKYGPCMGKIYRDQGHSH